jgi:hypothetical protein
LIGGVILFAGFLLLALIGVMTRMSQLRAFHLEEVPQLAEYMPRIPAQERLHGLSLDRRQGFLSAAGMVAVVTAVLIGGSAGLLASVLSRHSLSVALPIGALVAIAAGLGLTEHQRAAWMRAESAL